MELTFGNKTITFQFVDHGDFYVWEAEHNEDMEPDFFMIQDQNSKYYVWFDALPGSRRHNSMEGEGVTPQEAMNNLAMKLKKNYSVLSKYFG